MSKNTSQLRSAMIIGITLTFVFAIVMQLVADGVAWVTSTRVAFLFPMGFEYALSNISHLISVIFSLTLTGAALGGVFYWRARQLEHRAANRFWTGDAE